MQRRMVVAAILVFFSAPSWAAHRVHPVVTDYAYARVVDVRPIYGYVTVNQPRRECWEEVVYEPLQGARHSHDAAPVLAGGVIGGLIGHKLGHGRNRGALTLLGAVAGSAIASDYASQHDNRHAHDHQAVTVERCEVVHEHVRERRIEAYDVAYRYRGRRHWLRTDRHPGQRIRIRVSAAMYGH